MFYICVCERERDVKCFTCVCENLLNSYMYVCVLLSVSIVMWSLMRGVWPRPGWRGRSLSSGHYGNSSQATL